MWQAHEFIRRIGAVLRTANNDLTHEPLPERWVDLIHYLDEKEWRDLDEKEWRESRQRQRQPN